MIFYISSEKGKYLYPRCLREHDTTQFIVKFVNILVENCPIISMIESIISACYIKMNKW